MSEVKEFFNEQQKDFYEIATGIQEVNILNFSNAKSILRPKELMQERRTDASRLVLDTINTLSNYYTLGKVKPISETQYKVFVQTPNQFKLFAQEDSGLFNIQQSLKDLSSFNNDFLMNYIVSLKLIDFLFKRNNYLTEQLNDSNKKLEELAKAVNVIQEQKIVRVEPIPEVKQELILTETEKSFKPEEKEEFPEETTETFDTEQSEFDKF